MTIKGFDPEKFANRMQKESSEILPKDLSNSEKKYIKNKILAICLISGNHINENFDNNFNAKQAELITQFIAEWAFHKSIDIIRAKIPREFIDDVIYKVAYNALQTTIHSFIDIMKLSSKEIKEYCKISEKVEININSTYKSELNLLVDKGYISCDKFYEAIALSHLDERKKIIELKKKIKFYFALFLITVLIIKIINLYSNHLMLFFVIIILKILAFININLYFG